MKLTEAYNKIILELYGQIRGQAAVVTLQEVIEKDPHSAQELITEFLDAEKDVVASELANLLYTIGSDE